MPIGKDSIQKRVAKVTETAPAEEVKVEVAAETAPDKQPAAPRKRTTSSAPKSASSGTKKTTSSSGAKKTTTAKKPAVKTEVPKEEKPAEIPPATSVLSNVAPETVAAVIGHDEKKPSDKVKIGQKMPNYLL